MGLDMYLSKRIYVQNWSHFKADEYIKVIILKGGKPHPDINTSKISDIIQEVAYWRKAWPIHNWLVGNCDDEGNDGSRFSVTIEMLEELVKLCKKLIRIKNKRVAKNLLPVDSILTMKGIKTSQYDEYYYDMLQSTIDQLEPELENPGSGYYDYSASW